MINPLPNVSGGNVTRGRRIHRVSKRVTGVGNEAGGNMRVQSFYRASNVERAASSRAGPGSLSGERPTSSAPSRAPHHNHGDSKGNSPSCANSLHSGRMRGRSGHAARSRSRGGVTRGRGAIMHNVSLSTRRSVCLLLTIYLSTQYCAI